MAKDSVNNDKALCLSHTYQLLLGAGKAALFPFLTIYFRMLGLSATQTSLVFGAKAFMSVVCGPTWTSCAKRFNKKKLVMVFAMFTMLASSLLLALVPPADENLQLAYCSAVMKNGSVDLLKSKGGMPNSQTQSDLNATKLADKMKGSPAVTLADVSVSITPKTLQIPSTTSATVIIPESTNSMLIKRTTTSETRTTRTVEPSMQKTKKPNVDNGADSRSVKVDENSSSHSSLINDCDTDSALVLNCLGPKQLNQLKSFGINKDSLQGVTLGQLEEILNQANNAVSEKRNPKKRNAIEKIQSKWSELTRHFDLVGYETFMFILTLVIVGELFSASHDKLADDCWFEYLDITDDLEHYGQHQIWKTVGFVLMPTVVTAIVDHTDCMLPFGINHFTIHFFTFAGFASIAFMMVFCYPVSQHKQTAKKSRLLKGIKLLCSDLHAVGFTISVMLMGAASAVISNFLFWKLQDLGSMEIVMGTAVAASAGSEFVMLLIGKGLVKKITSIGAVTLGLLFLGGRLLLYSFLWTPWMVIVGEVFQGFSVTMVWIAVQTYPDFRINPYVMDRSAFTVLNALNYGVGFGGASMVAGLVYDRFGYAILNQGMSVIVFTWAVVFFVIQRTVKKNEKVRYAKLLQDENAYDSDDSVVYEDDWLEVAMKRER